MERTAARSGSWNKPLKKTVTAPSRLGTVRTYSPHKAKAFSEVGLQGEATSLPGSNFQVDRSLAQNKSVPWWVGLLAKKTVSVAMALEVWLEQVAADAAIIPGNGGLID
jgi:hypothetical protein